LGVNGKGGNGGVISVSFPKQGEMRNKKLREEKERYEYVWEKNRYEKNSSPSEGIQEKWGG